MLVKQFTNNPDNEVETKNPEVIQDNREVENQEILNLNPSPEAYIKSKLSLGLIDQIIKNPNLSEDELKRYNEIKDEINKYNYFFIYDDINIHDYNLIRNLKEINNEIEEPKIENEVNEEINYDIEFHKIGSRCSGIKERSGIIEKGKLFSSTKPKKEIKNIKDLKDKTPFLQDAEIIKETKSEIENNKDKGEWGSKKKNYRIRINYYTKPGDLESKRSSFFLYLESEEALNEVYLILCNMRLSFTNKESLKITLDKVNTMLMNRKKFYTIIKLLSLKNKIKNRKTFFNSVENLIKNKVDISVNLIPDFLKGKPKEPQQINISSLVQSDPFKVNNSKINVDIDISRKEESNLKEKTILRAINPRKIFYEPLNDNYMPLITNNNFFDESTNKRTLPDLETKLAQLKDIIPSNILHQNKTESNNQKAFFNIDNIKIEKDGDLNNLTLDPSYCENAKYVCFNKEDNEIIFKQDNKEDINEEEIGKVDILSSVNIHEISNVIYEFKPENNLEIKNSIDEQERTLTILGPKKDNDTEIIYKYKDYIDGEFKDNDNVYIDPEACSIKSKTINQFNQKEIEGVNLKIIQSEINVNDQNIVEILKDIPGNIYQDIDPSKIKDELLFGYTIRLGNLKKIKGDYFQPKDNNDKTCFLEYNKQYFIPKEYFTKDIIVENYCLPKYNFNGKDHLSEEEKSKLGEFLSPVKIGYVKLNYEDLVSSKKFEFPIQNNDIDLPNSFMIIDGYPERREVQKLAHIKGKDYSIGGNSYLETIIDGKFFNDEKENKDIPDNIKKKYFDLSVEDDNIYLKPNENMPSEQFEKDILNQISELEYQKIKNNKIYNFIPCCEKYIDEKSLFESKNLKSLTDEQKNFIVKNFKEGDWIYKVPKLKVKLLTKNIAVYQNQGEIQTKIKQYIYCNGKEKDLDIEKLTDDKIVTEKIIPINENCFNIFENNDCYDLRSIKNSNDYQWKLNIKFKNDIEMKSFLKLLVLFRKKANEKQNLDIDKNEYDMKEIIDIEQKGKGKHGKRNLIGALDNIRTEEAECIINISFINFIEDINFNNEKEKKPHIRFKLYRGLGGGKNSLIKKINESPFKNSLLESDKLKEYLNEKIYSFNKKLRFDIDRYKKGHRLISFGKNMTSNLSSVFGYDFLIERDYKLLINLFDDENEKYYSNLNILRETNDEICNKYELPIFKENVENKIFGCIGVDIFEKEFIPNILQKYEEINQDKINNPLLLISKVNKKENDNNILNNCFIGIYEPNIFRRKILRKINKLKINPTLEIQNIPNSDIQSLDKISEKKCIKKNKNWKKDIQLDKELYKKKYILKLIDIQRHEKFLEDYRELEWKSFLEKMNNDIKDLKKENLIQNQKQTDELYNLICFGITNKENREIFYKIFLDIDKLINQTKEKLKNFINIEDDNLLKYFSSFIENKANIIFSLIDNDCSNLCYLPNIDLNKINSVKKIVKSFFVWAELNIGLNDTKIKYVYFIGMLYITYKLYNYFENENLTFLLLIGLSQKISHFKQQNPLYNGILNYINLFGLVTKLVLEKYHPEIYKKFISLNFPIEFFLSKYLSSLYTNYFEDELMMRIFDIIIFESGIEGKYIDDLQYLRVLVAIPITLFEFNKKDIIECESVSELESMINNLIFYSFNMNKFKVHLKNNLKKIFVLTGTKDEFGNNDEKLKWDNKRGKLYSLINSHFRPVYLDNMNYLFKIKEQLVKQMKLGSNIYDEYIYQMNQNEDLKSVKKLHESDFRIIIQISKLQQIYNNEFIDINEFNLEISFDKNVDTFPTKELILNFDSKNNKILNIKELYCEIEFLENQLPNRIYFTLSSKDNKEKIFANFSYKLSNIKLMKITNIILENIEDNDKYLLEVIFYKDTSKDFEQNKFNLYKEIFRTPNYIHSNKIDEELSSCKISNFFFDNKLSNLINHNNKKINEFVINSNYDNNKYEYFKSLNNIIKENNNKSCINDISNFLGDNEDIKNIIKNWLNKSDVSIEEIFYSIALIDKSSCINENINLLYKIAQTKDSFLKGDEQKKLSVDKVKEMVYSLYKRFMVYFSKSDVDRMIDYLKKGERLFNIKYAFIYKEENENEIDDFIFDRNRANPKLNNELIYQIVFDDINKQLNNYLNYLANNYYITDIPQVVLNYILKSILENSEHIKKYIENHMNRLTLAIENDNLIYKKEYSIVYSESSISSIRELNIENIPQNDILNENIDKLMFSKINDLNISSEYSSEKYISFDKFKKIFFNLPYLSDLLRISLTYNINNNEFEYNDNPKEFEYFKVIINYENDIDNNKSILDPNDKTSNLLNFYFPENNEIISSENNNSINMNKKIKSNYTINNIIEDLIKKLENSEKKEQKIEVIKRCLNMIDKIQLYIYYYMDENNEQDLKYTKIGYFDCLNSIPILKSKNKIVLKIVFLAENFNLSKSINLKLKSKGYCKIFHNVDKTDFFWKKVKINNNKEEMKGKVKCFNNYEAKLNEQDYTLAYNFNY